MKRVLGWFIVAVVVAVIFWRFPLFRVVSLQEAAAAKATKTFNATEFAEEFWNTRLMQSLERAVSAEKLLTGIRNNPADAKKNFGRTLGVSESYTFFVAGHGRVVAANEDEVQLVVSEGATEAEVSLQVGLLFNSAVRDGTGLLNVSDYPNSQDFNAISEALNRIIEERVQPPLREQAQVGRIVRFVGCAEVNHEETDLKPLKIVPIQASVE